MQDKVNISPTFPKRPIFTDYELINMIYTTHEKYTKKLNIQQVRHLPRISVSFCPPDETPEHQRLLADTTDKSRWQITTSEKSTTPEGITQRYHILEKIKTDNKGKIILCLNDPFIAFLDYLQKDELRNANIAILNPGITQEVIDQNNKKIIQLGLNIPKITSTEKAFMSIKNKQLLEERGAVPIFWDTNKKRVNEVSELKNFLKNDNIKGIVINGGSIPATAEWLMTHLYTIHEYLEKNPDKWCAMLCAPIYVLNSGLLHPTYEADVYAIPKNAIKYGTGYVGDNIAVNAHSDSRPGNLKKFYHLNTKVVIDIPERGIFIY